MSQMTAIQPRYVKAGKQIEEKMRFTVRDGVRLKDAYTVTNDASRSVFTSCKNAVRSMDFSMPLWAAVLIVLLAVLYMFSRGGAALALKEQARSALQTKGEEYAKIEATISEHQSALRKACDESLICRTAVEKLGMKRAADGARILISAPDTRPPALNGALTAGAQGHR